MAIRARIKSKIKSLLFGTSSTTKSEPVSSPSAPKPFTTPTVSTAASTSSVSQEASKNVVDPISTSSVQKLDTETTNKEQPVEKQETSDATSDGTITKSTGTKSTGTKSTGEKSIELDMDNASFIIEITDLFPETCPHCEASSHNNWIRIENKFACGSCETAY